METIPFIERGKPRASSRRYSRATDKSDELAGCIGLLLGPVGLWYKGQWAAGFAWLVGAVIGGIVSGGILAPLFWIGMAVHAYQADPE